LNNGGGDGGKEKGRVMEGIELTTVRYGHSRNISRNPLNIYLEINFTGVKNIYSGGVLVGGARINKGD
jgi:hypothetical protein